LNAEVGKRSAFGFGLSALGAIGQKAEIRRQRTEDRLVNAEVGMRCDWSSDGSRQIMPLSKDKGIEAAY